MPGHPDFARLMQGVLPYLAMPDAAKAAAFYQKAFGAVVHGDMVRDDKGRVMNATVEINGGIMMLMDAGLEGCSAEERPATNQGMTLQLVTDQGDMWWNRAVAAGCTVTMPFAPQFWGDRYGRLRDPFGLDWAVHEPGPGRG